VVVNVVCVTGSLTRTPVFSQTASAAPSCSFVIAVPRRLVGIGGPEPGVVYVPVVVQDAPVLESARALRCGDVVAISGLLDIDRQRGPQSQRSRTTVRAERIERISQ
jgi:single-stranded DNA-binding protein